MEALQVHLPVFEGPLELLLHLIEKNKLDIYDIPVFEITKQYLAYLQSWDEMNMEVASEFIVMAATLISIKAKRLLPAAQKQEEDEEDEEAALLRRLLLYKRYKEGAIALQALLRNEHELILTRKPETIQGKRPVPPVAELLQEVSLQELYGLYAQAVRSKRESYDTVRAHFRSVEKETYTVSEKIKALQETLELFEQVSFYELQEKSRSKNETITYFMAMLELSRMNQVKLDQDKLFGDIIMKPKTMEEKSHGETLPGEGV